MLRRFAKLTAFATLFLIFAGAMVTSTDSGLAVPDWPLSYGMLMPPMVGGIFYEHGHRMIATAVGFLTLVQALWLHYREPKKFVRVLGWIALAAVIVQGILGGLTVRFLLPTAISVSHASLAELFFCMNVSIAFFTSRFFTSIQDRNQPDEHRTLATCLWAAVFIQIVIGALMRHLNAGFLVPDFPKSFGKWIPPIDSLGIATNFAHRAWGITIAILVVALAPLFLRRGGALAKFYSALLVLMLSQIVLAAASIFMVPSHPNLEPARTNHAIVTSLHVMNGAAIFAITLLVALIAHSTESRIVKEESVEAGIGAQA